MATPLPLVLPDFLTPAPLTWTFAPFTRFAPAVTFAVTLSGLPSALIIFGETASRRKMRLKLIVHLQRMQPVEMSAAQRLPTEDQSMSVLGVDVRRVVLPVAAGRNLAVLIEGAVRSTILLLRGIDSMQEFIDRQQSALDGEFGDG